MLLLTPKVTKSAETNELPPSTDVSQVTTGIIRFRLQRVTDLIQITKRKMKSNWKLIESKGVENADLHSLPAIVVKILSNRGIDNPKSFFSSSFEGLHDPFLIHDMDRAVDRILQSIEKKEKIFTWRMG